MAMIQCYTSIARRIISTQKSKTPILPSFSTLSTEPILCGRGDKRTKKGKRFKGSFGNSRPKKKEMIQRIKDKVEVPRRLHHANSRTPTHTMAPIRLL